MTWDSMNESDNLESTSKGRTRSLVDSEVTGIMRASGLEVVEALSQMVVCAQSCPMQPSVGVLLGGLLILFCPHVRDDHGVFLGGGSASLRCRGVGFGAVLGNVSQFSTEQAQAVI